MFITEDFVLLNLPKSASTFSRTVLKKVYKNRSLNRHGHYAKWVDRFLPSKGYLDLKLFSSPNHPDSQHLGYSELPDEFKDRPVISTVRNPYSRYVSQYHYRGWANKPWHLDKTTKERWPNFPDLAFSEMYALRKEWLAMKLDISPEQLNYGQYTHRFVRMYAKDPKVTWRQLIDGESFEKIAAGMAGIRFIRQEHLRDDWASVLKEFNVPEEEIEVIYNHENVNQSSVKKTEKHKLSDEEKDQIRKDDWFVFDFLKSKGIDYA